MDRRSPFDLATKGGLRIVLAADSWAEGRTSMNLYATSVHAALLELGDGTACELVRPSLHVTGGRVALKVVALKQRYFTIPRAMRSVHADVVHIADPAYGHLIPLASPAKVVVTCHDLIPLEADRWNGSRKLLSPGWHLYRRAISHLAKADAIVVPTAATKGRLIRLLGEQEDRITVIPYGVDEAFHEAKWHPPVGVTRVLYVGSNAWYKRVELVVETVIRLAAAGHRVEFVKAGHELPTPLADRVRAAGVTLEQLGRVSNRSLAGVYSKATLLLFPSSNEGFGLPVAEAMAVGLPTVTSDIDTLLEVSGGYAAHASGDAKALTATVEQLINDPESLQRMSRIGREWATRYRWSTHATGLRRVYSAVLG